MLKRLPSMRDFFRRFHLAGLTLVMAAGALVSCNSEKKQSTEMGAEGSPAKHAPKPPDESRRFPKANLLATKVIDRDLMGKSFMPGGTFAEYKKGKSEYQMFVARTASATDAAIALADWRKALTGPKLVPSFGGYFGQDGETPVFVFSKGPWVAGVKGLPEKDSDLQARTLASLLPAQ